MEGKQRELDIDSMLATAACGLALSLWGIENAAGWTGGVVSQVRRLS
jgi:hypothetical protein